MLCSTKLINQCGKCFPKAENSEENPPNSVLHPCISTFSINGQYYHNMNIERHALTKQRRVVNGTKTLSTTPPCSSSQEQKARIEIVLQGTHFGSLVSEMCVIPCEKFQHRDSPKGGIMGRVTVDL